MARFIDEYLSYLLARANHAVYMELDAEVRAVGLTSLEWRVLATLSDSPGCTIGELAAEVVTKQPTLTKLVQRMREAGWVQVADDATDNRRTQVSISPVGKTLVRPLLKRARQQEAALFSAWPTAQVTEFKAMLKRLREAPAAATIEVPAAGLSESPAPPTRASVAPRRKSPEKRAGKRAPKSAASATKTQRQSQN